ncbi:hypothetical protein FEM48_Zijuj05G0129200 [Ziziphus jujuba var. spinosa]|uniref:ATP-dependent DNA helicase n=1 Tax=Ziziphus jujuba var. spinosa TaxID=714518 RepID=A0A978VEY4_ZIZJJ|nr:hypothetical protein FEM48_Zijuj05G0129200 [Ziziphus jujuba var. spinosa]
MLTIASSGVVSLLLEGGKTTHSRFAIPLAPNEYSTCNIKKGSPLAELIVKTKLIICDEAPMMSRYCFEVLDRTMRDILRFRNPLRLEQPVGDDIYSPQRWVNIGLLIIKEEISSKTSINMEDGTGMLGHRCVRVGLDKGKGARCVARACCAGAVAWHEELALLPEAPHLGMGQKGLNSWRTLTRASIEFAVDSRFYTPPKANTILPLAKFNS